MPNFRYSILTFIIGKGYEKLHEIKNKQNDVEYVLVTDDAELKSNTWNIVVDQSLSRFSSAFEKCFYVRYNAFRYCSSDICVTIDGSMEVKGSLDALIQRFIDGNYDICLMPHPLWSNIITEYQAWIKLRNYPISQAQHAIDFLQKLHYDFNFQGLYQLCFTIKKKTALTENIDQLTWQLLCNLSRGLPQFERLDQTIFSYVINTYFTDINIYPVSEQIVRSYAIAWKWHGTDNDNMNIFYDISKPDIKYVLNKQVVCDYLI